MKTVIALIALVALPGLTFASEADLQRRIDALEARIAALEAAMKPVSADQDRQARIDANRQKAQARMREDLDVYSREQLREIEALYQVANKQWRSEEGKASLRKLIAAYKKANRTGCALLYLGQMSEGDEQLDFLTQAIEGFSDCFYGDGVQVGAYARFVLSGRYLRDGNRDKAMALIEEIRTRYPDAVDHRGQSLIEIIDRELPK